MARRRKRKTTTVARRRRRMRGKGFFKNLYNFGKKANRFLRKTKIVSRVGKALGMAGVPYAGKIASTAGALGYGKKRRRRVVRRRRRGRGVTLAGGGIRLAGGRYGKKKSYRGRGRVIPLAAGY